MALGMRGRTCLALLLRLGPSVNVRSQHGGRADREFIPERDEGVVCKVREEGV